VCILALFGGLGICWSVFADSNDDVDVNYGAKGYSENREYYRLLPNETVDPFTGNLGLIFTPISLPQKGGWDFKLNLVYNSNLMAER